MYVPQPWLVNHSLRMSSKMVSKVKVGRFHSPSEKYDTIRIKVYKLKIFKEGDICNTVDVAFHPLAIGYINKFPGF